MNRDKTRVAVYTMGGIYLLYLAWNMFRGLSDAGSEKTLMIVFIILFALIGAGLVVWGLYTGWKFTQDMSMGAEPEAETEQPEESGEAEEPEQPEESGEPEEE